MPASEPFIKVCGVRDAAVLEAAIEAGASALGFNFVPGVRRAVAVDTAEALIERARRRFGRLPRLVGIFADAPPERIDAVRQQLRLDLVQLHGHEPPEAVAAAAPAYKAIRLGSRDDLADLVRYPGDFVLVDARVAGLIGGTGRQVPLELAVEAARRRAVVLAGGLNADNVAEVVSTVRPAGVDTASGAEVDGVPSADAAARFVAAARAAFEQERG